MSTPYTTGPWEYGENPKGSYSNSMVVRPLGEFPHGAWIADVGSGHGESQANARLIAASPTMLEALRAVYDWQAGSEALPLELWTMLRAAISKAEDAA